MALLTEALSCYKIASFVQYINVVLQTCFICTVHQCRQSCQATSRHTKPILQTKITVTINSYKTGDSAIPVLH